MRRTLHGSVVILLIAATLVPAMITPSAAAPVPAPPLCETVIDGIPSEDPCTLTGRMDEVGTTTFEPTMGAAPDGSLYYSTTPDREALGGVVSAGIGFGASVSRSGDGGATWKDVGARLAGQRVPYETNDPYVYVDESTGRIFKFHMSPILTCSQLSFSDDGGTSWTTNPLGCGPTAVWDHQTMVAAKPRTLPTSGYPNIVHQCVNAVYAEMCSRSLDGGRTWSPSTLAWPNTRLSAGYGTQTGHLRAAPNGILYLPTSDGATFPTVAVSRDDGLTWTKVRVANTATVFDDPAVAVDPAGNVFVAFYDTAGQLYVAVSRDEGQSYSTPVKAASNKITASKLAMVAGDVGKIAIAHLSTASIPGQWPGRSALSTTDANAVRWSAFMTVSTNALNASPAFTTLEANGTDPLAQRLGACGPAVRCAYTIDFIGSAITPDGRPYGAFVDGCITTCATTIGASNNVSGTTGRAVVASVDVDLCEARCAQFGPPSAGDIAVLAEGSDGGAGAWPAALLPVIPTSVLESAAAQAAADRARLLKGGDGVPMGLRG